MSYRENARWVPGPVVYVTLNFQGSNDNLPHAGVDGETRSDAEIARQTAEHYARQAANIHWLQESFAAAKRIGAKGVVIDGLLDLPAELRRQVLAFDGQTLLVHGDSHYFKVDKPLNYDNRQVMAKFTRVETFGPANTHWVQLTVAPHDRQLFRIEPRIVPANVDDR